jgi:hypothetical protein
MADIDEYHHHHDDVADDGSIIVYGGDACCPHQPWSLSQMSRGNCFNSNNNMTKKDQLSTFPPLRSPPRKEKSMLPSRIVRRQDRRKRHRLWKQIQQKQEQECEYYHEENRFSDDEKKDLHSNDDLFASLESLMDQLSQEQREQVSYSNKNQSSIAADMSICTANDQSENATICSSKKQQGRTKNDKAEDCPHYPVGQYGHGCKEPQNACGYVAPSPPDFDVCVHNDHDYDETDDETFGGMSYDYRSKNVGSRKKPLNSSLNVGSNERSNGQPHHTFNSTDTSKNHHGRKDVNGSFQSSSPPPSTTTVEKVKSIVGLR